MKRLPPKSGPSTALAAPGGQRDRSTLPKGPADKVTLGKTGIQVSLVGMGTGSVGSGQASNQTKLGVKGFTRALALAMMKDEPDRYVAEMKKSRRPPFGPRRRHARTCSCCRALRTHSARWRKRSCPT